MNRLGWIGSFCLAAPASLALAFDAFSFEFHSGRLAIVLAVLLLLHVVRFARVDVTREALLYACFVTYMLVQLTWTHDRETAMNTVLPAVDFLLVMVLFGSFLAFHDTRAILWGTLAGFLAAAAIYSRRSGFPFQIPDEFSYNAIAGMYLFGLIVTLLLVSYGRRTWPLLVLAALIGAHVLATTSIKTNVGILVGVGAVALIHLRGVSRLVLRNAPAILVIGAVLAFGVGTNEAAVQAVQRGTNRVTLGIQILDARQNLQGSTSFGRRTDWQREGIRGWIENPVFGHGVEAFRSRFGITSHASHVDILYNSGLIGIGLFYGIFISMLLRLYRARHGGFRNARLVILGSLVCCLFMSFAGTIYYVATLAALLALGIGILKRA